MATVAAEARILELSFEDVFATEYRRLVQAVYLICGSTAEAEDIAQESLARAYERWDRIGRMGSPVGYVYRTALNLHRRKERRRKLLHSKLAGPLAESEPLAEAETRSDVVRVLEAMPLPLRTVLILSELLDLSSAEVGKILGIKAVSVRTRLHRARTLFRELMGEGYA